MNIWRLTYVIINKAVKSGDWKNEKHVPEIEAKLEGGVAKLKFPLVPKSNTPTHSNTIFPGSKFLPSRAAPLCRSGKHELNNHGEAMSSPYLTFTPLSKPKNPAPSLHFHLCAISWSLGKCVKIK